MSDLEFDVNTLLHDRIEEIETVAQLGQETRSARFETVADLAGAMVSRVLGEAVSMAKQYEDRIRELESRAKRLEHWLFGPDDNKSSVLDRLRALEGATT